ncbi:MAG: class I SAM-dependent methyltransferase [Phycisphaeraceae bacterium]|nr:MAG: class I SAM-dependent methyltransferase [Phycisphaeraceae bacterium]
MRCCVCSGVGVVAFVAVDGRDYWRCPGCGATFLDRGQLPGADVERGQYELHENDPDDAGYRRFLDRLASPLLERLGAGCEGLDYGCGPGPALARMLEEAGHSVRLYDPFFQPDAGALERTYDFITCTETAEHFHTPRAEFERLAAMLRPGGALAVMTCFQTDDERFADWHYRRDPTHVVFYKEETFRRIGAMLGMRCEIPAKDVAILWK